MLENLFINMGISAILLAIKNPKKKVALKRAMLKLFLAIRLAYSSDPDFQ